MSATRQVTIWCDRCSTWIQASSTALALRRQLKKKGWVSEKGGLDYCPTCVEKRKAKAQKEGK